MTVSFKSSNLKSKTETEKKVGVMYRGQTKKRTIEEVMYCYC